MSRPEVRRWPSLGAILGFLLLAACGQKSGCYGLSDAQVVDRIARDYEALPAIEKADPAQTRFSRQRVLGIGRNVARKGSGQALTQVWFAQDDHTVTVATELETCQLSLRPNLTPDAIKQAAVPVKPPAF